jgi:hypothetical protein
MDSYKFKFIICVIILQFCPSAEASQNTPPSLADIMKEQQAESDLQEEAKSYRDKAIILIRFNKGRMEICTMI